MLGRWAALEGSKNKTNKLIEKANALEVPSKVYLQKLKTEKIIRQYELKIQQLEAEYEGYPTYYIRKELISQINSKVWCQFLTGQFYAAEADIRRGLEFDAYDLHLNAYMAPALLFQGKTEAAKQEYKKWEDKPFVEPILLLQGIPESDILKFAQWKEKYLQLPPPTYRDAFIDDLKIMEAAGIIPVDRASSMEEVRTLLNEK